MEHSELWGAIASHLHAWFAPVPGSTVISEAGGFMALTGLPTPDFNVVAVHDLDAARSLAERFTEHLARTDTPALVFAASEVSSAMSERASADGLQPRGTAPFMTLDADRVPDGDASDVEVLGPVDAIEYATVMADAFEMAPDIWQLFAESTFPDPAARVYGLRDEGELCSGVTITADGPIAGIWAMGTRTSSQRQGYGERLLAEVMRRERRRGAKKFYLASTPAGKFLYDRLGFVTLDEAQVWVRGVSPQFSS